MRIYYHKWGDEDVLRSILEITKDASEHYTIRFEQEAFESDSFATLEVKGDIIDQKTESKTNSAGIIKQTIIIKFKKPLNPQPEHLFKIID